MELKDIAALIHPMLAVVWVFPIVGLAVFMGWQTRQRRLQVTTGGKSKIAPDMGRNHVLIGQWLSGSVVGVTLIALFYSIFLKRDQWLVPQGVILPCLFFIATIAALVLLYRASGKRWRAVFATLTSMGLIILGAQDGVFRRTSEWYVSHYYYGIAASLLMVIALAIIPEIYRDRSQTWRRIHIALSCVALLLFLGQGFTGSRDLLEIPLSWQESHIYKCDFQNRRCP